MKKKHVWIILFSLLIVALFGTSGIKADAASKAATKKKVYKAITSVKNGKYTYYYDGKAIYREKAGVAQKKKKLSKYPADGEFILNGNYIYYHSKTENKIYRMTKAGKKHKKYSVSASGIRSVKNGYIYYNNAVGLNRIKTSGSKSTKKKIINYSNNYNSFIMGNRVYYSRTKITNNADGSQSFKSYIQSVNLSGKDKKTHKVFQDARNITLEGAGRCLYSSVSLKNGYELGVIDTKAKNPVYTALQFYEETLDESEYFDELDRYAPLAVVEGILYFQNKEYLYCMDKKGEVTQLAKMPAENVQGVKLEKQGDYYWLKFYGDDTFGENYIYNSKWELAKKLTSKYGDVEDLGIKGKKAYVIFNKSEDMAPSEKWKTYKIYDLK